MKLRPYEKRAVAELQNLLKRHKRVIAVGPTGCGKTVIGAALLALMKRKRVLWIAHRYELLSQARAQLLAAGIPEEDVGILSGVEKANTKARILVASVDIFHASGTTPLPKCDVIVIDEAHHVMADSYRNIIRLRPRAVVLGLTATPRRLDGEPLGDVFRHLYTIAEAVELHADGYLLPAVVYGVPHEKALALVKGASGGKGKDYSPRKLERAMAKRPLMADIVSERQRLAAGERTLVYACTRAHGQQIAKRFKKAGAPVAYIDAMTPAAEREALLGPGGKLVRGEIEVVVNVGVLTEGFDCPPVSCIIVARPTKSLVLWRQMCGRGARPWKGKKRFLVLDHAGNSWRHGFPDSPREWSLAGEERGGGPMPVKRCTNLACGCLMPIAATECPECGAEQPVSERTLKEQEAEMERLRAAKEEVAKRESVIRGIAEAKGLDAAWVARALREVA